MKNEKVKKLKDGIRKHAPVVAEFFDRDDILADYARSLYQFTSAPEHRLRQKTVCAQAQTLAKLIFSLDINLEPPLAMNIVDHHSWLNHPILIATNIVANAHRLVAGKDKRPVVVLSSSIVPPNNFFNKKGFLFHNRKISLFPNKLIHCASCFLPLIDLRFSQRLKQLKQWNDFTAAEQDFLMQMENEINGLDFSRARHYSDQISVIDRHVWQQLFHNDVRASVPELLYITEEEIVARILPELLNADSIVSRVLFEPDFRADVLSAFDGISGCWNSAKQTGTHFFWYRRSDQRAGRMKVQDNELAAEDDSLNIALEPDSIRDALADGKIVPDMFTIYGYLTFWCGIRPLVGHGSANYMTRMKDAWLQVLARHDPAEKERVAKIDTKGLIGGAVATFKRDAQGQIKMQYAMDVIADGGLSKEYLERLTAMKMNDLLAPALLEIYESYVPVAERENLGLEPADMVGPAFAWIK